MNNIRGGEKLNGITTIKSCPGAEIMKGINNIFSHKNLHQISINNDDIGQTKKCPICGVLVEVSKGPNGSKGQDRSGERVILKVVN